MTVTAYYSTDASAPTLTGATGSLVALLDAILVNGYGAKAAAGWTIAYTGTSKRDYKQGTGSNGYYLDVDDSGPGTGSYREARLRGYETMSALGAGTQAFPTAGQSNFGVVCRKSNTADSTARPWYAVADATCFHLFVDTGDYTNPSYSMAVSFGDIFSYKSGDIYNTVIIGRGAENTNNQAYEALGTLCFSSHILDGTLQSVYGGVGHYIDRIWTGTGSSVPFNKFSSQMAGAASGNSAVGPCGGNSCPIPYPNGPDAALELAPIWVGHSYAVRGYLKGLWAPCHYRPCAHGDTFSGTGNMSGKSFLALNIWGNASSINSFSNNDGQIIVETSNTWS